MDLSLIKDLELLNQTGNFSQAARIGNISQPAFSRRIKALENWVGVELVDRSRKPVRLTTAGSQILETGKQSIALIENERSEILAAHSRPDEYVVTFGIQHSITWHFYTNWLRTLEEDYGPIYTRLRTDDQEHCLKDLRDGNVDFVIAYSVTGERVGDRDGKVIGTDRLVPVCKPHLNGKPMFDFVDQTDEIPYLHFGDDAPFSRHLAPLFEANDLTSRLHPVYKNAVAGPLLIRAREGSGVAWLPESLIGPDLENGTLVRTGHTSWSIPLEIRLIRSRRNANQLTRSIWSFLENR